MVAVGALLTAATILTAALVAAGALTATPNDPLFGEQWGLTMIGAPQAWATTTGANVIVGIVDTGVDLTHQDLAAHVVASTNCIGSDGDPTQCHGNGQDDNGEGTHVAGIVNAITNNGVGVAGTAPDARLVVAKSLDSGGTGTVADVDAGIEWVVDHGAKVVNLSLGQPDALTPGVFGTSLASGIEYAWSKGAIPVLATGKSVVAGLGTTNYGNLDAVVVGAVARNSSVPSYSSPTGSAKWALLAPGGSDDGVQADDIVSTYWVSGETNQYGYLAGTAMAAPFVSGTLALLLSLGLTPQAAISRLLATVNTSVDCGAASTNCHGLVDAAAAVAGLPSTSASSATSTTLAGASGATTTSSELPTTTSTTPAGAGAAGINPPATVAAAPPAVMLPSPTTGPRRPGTTLAPSRPRTKRPTVTTPSGRDALGPPATKRGPSSAIEWFAALAAVFVVLIAGGLVGVVRGAGSEAE